MALRKVMKPTDEIDIPVKPLDDAMMIQVMANENHESWGMLPKVIDETIKVAKKFLEDHPKVKELVSHGRPNQPVGAPMISDFLGPNWSESRISYSLERMALHDKGILNKKATDILPTERSARNLVKAVKEVKGTTPAQQRRAAERPVGFSNPY
jgi:hypothetical protein